MDTQQHDHETQTGFGEVIGWILGALFVVFIGLPVFGVLVGIVAAVGAAVLGLVFTALPFVIGLAVIAGIVSVFSDDS